jgi:putative ABC transport system permease protein
MRTPLALHNLWNDKGRTLVALTGTAFAVVLVLMQLGFFRSVLHTANILYEQTDFDLAITSVNYRQMLKTGVFDRARLLAVEALPEVESTSPLSIQLHLYRNPENGLIRAILIVGVDPRRDDFRMVLPEQMQLIYADDCVLMDRKSRPEFGPRYVGLETQIADRRVTITGLFELGTGFGADGIIICSDETFADLFFPRRQTDISVGLVHLRPGHDAKAVAHKLNQLLPPDVRALTRAEFLADEQHYWVVKTSVGIIFGLGVIVAMLVGTAIVYQVLSADIAKRMPEYATLKAMGYSRRYLSTVILTQAAVIGVLGFLPGWFIADALYAVTRREASIWMEMGTVIPTVTFVLSVAMCCLSGLASLHKVHHADPAELFV